MGQRLVEEGMESCDLVARDGDGVGAEKPGGKGGLCDGDLVRGHRCWVVTGRKW